MSWEEARIQAVAGLIHRNLTLGLVSEMSIWRINDSTGWTYYLDGEEEETTIMVQGDHLEKEELQEAIRLARSWMRKKRKIK